MLEASLPQSVGYALILGGGIFFAVLMNLLTMVQNKYTRYNSTKVDEFVSSSRSVGFGIMLSGILSNWTWSLTLLEPGSLSYNFGITGSYWYGVGGLMQLAVFAVISSKVKKNANLVTTFPEMGYFRFGVPGHLSFLFSGFVCNAIVTSCILLGGTSVFAAVTGMSHYAAIWLIPAGVAVYVSFGGLRATFISDATHTCVLLIFIIFFMFEVYVRNDKIGSPRKMLELLAQSPPVKGNYHGSYATFRTREGAIFSFIMIITGFGLVVNDQSYLSRAVAADPKITSRAYFYASICWFIIPFAMGDSLGLAARALGVYPDFPKISEADISAGLTSVASITYLMGKLGSAMILVMVFFSVTSSLSGELIGTSTLISYDIYKRYIKPSATPDEVVRVAKLGVFGWAIFSSALALIFYGAADISMGWLFNFLGVATASGVFPIALAFTWKDLNQTGAVGGSVGGMILALIAWLVTCKYYMGEITIANLSNRWVSFAGNGTAFFMGGIISITCSLIKPANFDFDLTRNRTCLLENLIITSTVGVVAKYKTSGKADNTEDINVEQNSQTDVFDTEKNSQFEMTGSGEIDHEHLDRQYRKYSFLVVLVSFIGAIVTPVSLGAAPYVFSPKFFAGFILLMIIWLFFSFACVILLPLYEGRKEIVRIVRAICKKRENVEP